MMTSASSIPRHVDFRAAPRNSLLAAKFAVCHRKTRNCPFFATFISNSRFLGLLVILSFIKQQHLVVGLCFFNNSNLF